MIYSVKFRASSAPFITSDFLIANNEKNARLQLKGKYPNLGGIEEVTPLEKLTHALDDYCSKEFLDDRSTDGIEDFSNIGIAFTDIYEDLDEDGTDFDIHEMQVSLDLYAHVFMYYLDGDAIHQEDHASIDECAKEIEECDFEMWYSDFLRFCPENYH